MPNVTSETHKNDKLVSEAFAFFCCFCCIGKHRMPLATFFLLLLLNFGYLFLLLAVAAHRLLLLLRLGSRMENTMEKITCRQGNTMPLKDGEAPKLHPENA